MKPPLENGKRVRTPKKNNKPTTVNKRTPKKERRRSDKERRTPKKERRTHRKGRRRSGDKERRTPRKERRRSGKGLRRTPRKERLRKIENKIHLVGGGNTDSLHGIDMNPLHGIIIANIITILHNHRQIRNIGYNNGVPIDLIGNIEGTGYKIVEDLIKTILTEILDEIKIKGDDKRSFGNVCIPDNNTLNKIYKLIRNGVNLDGLRTVDQDSLIDNQEEHTNLSKIFLEDMIKITDTTNINTNIEIPIGFITEFIGYSLMDSYEIEGGRTIDHFFPRGGGPPQKYTKHLFEGHLKGLLSDNCNPQTIEALHEKYLTDGTYQLILEQFGSDEENPSTGGGSPLDVMERVIIKPFKTHLTQILDNGFINKINGLNIENIKELAGIFGDEINDIYNLLFITPHAPGKDGEFRKNLDVILATRGNDPSIRNRIDNTRDKGLFNKNKIALGHQQESVLEKAGGGAYHIRTFIDFIDMVLIHADCQAGNLGCNKAIAELYVKIIPIIYEKYARNALDIIRKINDLDMSAGAKATINKSIEQNVNNNILTYLKIRIDDPPGINDRFNFTFDNDSNLANTFAAGGMHDDKFRDLYLRYNASKDEINAFGWAAPKKNAWASPDEWEKLNNDKPGAPRLKYDYVFGKFTEIFTEKDDTKEMVKRMTNMDLTGESQGLVKQLTSGKPVFILGYGASGSGKTSTLINLNYKDKKNVSIQKPGILIELCSVLASLHGYTHITVKSNEYFRNNNDEENPSTCTKWDNEDNLIKCSMNKDIEFEWNDGAEAFKMKENEGMSLDYKPFIHKNRFKENEQSESHDGLAPFIEYLVDKDRFVKATTNNPQSSRSHTLVYIELRNNEDEKAHLFVGDFAGVENEFPCEDVNTIKKMLSIYKDSELNPDNIPFYSKNLNGGGDDDIEFEIKKDYDTIYEPNSYEKLSDKDLTYDTTIQNNKSMKFMDFNDFYNNATELNISVGENIFNGNPLEGISVIIGNMLGILLGKEELNDEIYNYIFQELNMGSDTNGRIDRINRNSKKIINEITKNKKNLNNEVKKHLNESIIHKTQQWIHAGWAWGKDKLQYSLPFYISTSTSTSRSPFTKWYINGQPASANKPQQAFWQMPSNKGGRPITKKKTNAPPPKPLTAAAAAASASAAAAGQRDYLDDLFSQLLPYALKDISKEEANDISATRLTEGFPEDPPAPASSPQVFEFITHHDKFIEKIEWLLNNNGAGDSSAFFFYNGEIAWKNIKPINTHYNFAATPTICELIEEGALGKYAQQTNVFYKSDDGGRLTPKVIKAALKGLKEKRETDVKDLSHEIKIMIERIKLLIPDERGESVIVWGNLPPALMRISGTELLKMVKNTVLIRKKSMSEQKFEGFDFKGKGNETHFHRIQNFTSGEKKTLGVGSIGGYINQAIKREGSGPQTNTFNSFPIYEHHITMCYDMLITIVKRLSFGIIVCGNRVAEGKYINDSLKRVRDTITDIVGYKNRETISAIPDMVSDSCITQYKNGAGNDCFKLKPTAISNIHSEIFRDILTFYKPALAGRSNIPLKEIGPFYDDLLVSVFCVVNLSRDANNPPPTPHIDLSEINEMVHKATVVKGFLSSDEGEKAFLLATKNLENKLRYYEMFTSITADISNNDFSADGKLQILNENLPKIENSNAVTTIGTIEFIDRISKYQLTKTNCMGDYKDIMQQGDAATTLDRTWTDRDRTWTDRDGNLQPSALNGRPSTARGARYPTAARSPTPARSPTAARYPTSASREAQRLRDDELSRGGQRATDRFLNR